MSAKRKQKKSPFKSLISLVLVLAILIFGYFAKDYILDFIGIGNDAPISLSEIPEFSGKPYVKINGGVPFFTKEEITTKSFEDYSLLDELGRCGVAMACIGVDIMPKEDEDREGIAHVKPTGWVQAEYDCVSGNKLYNRCHLIGFQLTGENDNEKNLITGTRFMNWDGMVDFENMVADYIKDTGNHVMYRVTPIFEGCDYVARGVLMEAYSVEDNGDGIQFCVYCYNNQPGVVIDYKTGRSWLDGETPPPVDDDDDGGKDDGEGDGGEGGATTPGDSEITYILNTSKSSMKIHKPTCSKIPEKEENKRETTKSLEELVEEGYSPCGICKPDQKQ